MADHVRISLADAVWKGRLSLSAFHRPPESDPHGKKPTDPGAKLDAGKNRLDLVMEGFPRALQAIGEVATLGAIKYSEHGWIMVQDGRKRYTAAMYRHLLAEHGGEQCDPTTDLAHAAHAAWNALARLELMLREQGNRSGIRPGNQDGRL